MIKTSLHFFKEHVGNGTYYMFNAQCPLMADSPLRRHLGYQPEIQVPDDHTSGVVTVDPKGTTWNVFNNQLLLDFTNQMKDDTLFLLYTSSDATRPFKNSTAIKFPKPKTVFAKCYIGIKKEMGIIYINERSSLH